MEEQAKKNKRKLWIILTIVLIVVIVGWFTAVYHILQVFSSKKTTEESSYNNEEVRKQEVLAYLEERYGEEFEITSYRGKGYAYDYVQMYARPKSNPDEEHEFKIQGRTNESKEMEYTDTYVMVKLKDEYAAGVDEIIDEYFDDYKFYLEFSSEWITSNLPADAKVEDLFELRANVDYPIPHLDILLKPSQTKVFTENNIMDMCEELAVWGYRGRIWITCYDEEGYYEKKNSENHKELLEGEDVHSEYHTMFIEDKETILYR